MDRGYLDFDRLYRFTVEAAFFVLRNKRNVLLRQAGTGKKATAQRRLVWQEHPTSIRHAKSIVGPALVGRGTLVLLQNMAGFL